MADVITRFKLETTQYDSKLRDASKGLAEYARTASLAGKEFDKFTRNNVAAEQLDLLIQDLIKQELQ